MRAHRRFLVQRVCMMPASQLHAFTAFSLARRRMPLTKVAELLTLSAIGIAKASIVEVSSSSEFDAALLSRGTTAVNVTTDIMFSTTLSITRRSIHIFGSCGSRKCVLSGQGTVKMFQIYNGLSPTFTGLNFSQGRSTWTSRHGGCVEVGIGSASFIDCTFYKCSAVGAGGGVALTHSTSQATFTNWYVFTLESSMLIFLLFAPTLPQ